MMTWYIFRISRSSPVSTSCSCGPRDAPAVTPLGHTNCTSRYSQSARIFRTVIYLFRNGLRVGRPLAVGPVLVERVVHDHVFEVDQPTHESQADKRDSRLGCPPPPGVTAPPSTNLFIVYLQ